MLCHAVPCWAMLSLCWAKNGVSLFSLYPAQKEHFGSSRGHVVPMLVPNLMFPFILLTCAQDTYGNDSRTWLVAQLTSLVPRVQRMSDQYSVLMTSSRTEITIEN